MVVFRGREIPLKHSLNTVERTTHVSSTIKSESAVFLEGNVKSKCHVLDCRYNYLALRIINVVVSQIYVLRTKVGEDHSEKDCQLLISTNILCSISYATKKVCSLNVRSESPLHSQCDFIDEFVCTSCDSQLFRRPIQSRSWGMLLDHIFKICIKFPSSGVLPWKAIPWRLSNVAVSNMACKTLLWATASRSACLDNCDSMEGREIALSAARAAVCWTDLSWSVNRLGHFFHLQILSS